MDEWGSDPSVQIMRKVFKAMERAQDEFLRRLHTSVYDLRIRSWREKALAMFERAWTIGNQMGIIMDEKMASEVYVHCLAKIIGLEGNEVPKAILPEGNDAERLLEEVLK